MVGRLQGRNTTAEGLVQSSSLVHGGREAEPGSSTREEGDRDSSQGHPLRHVQTHTECTLPIRSTLLAASWNSSLCSRTQGSSWALGSKPHTPTTICSNGNLAPWLFQNNPFSALRPPIFPVANIPLFDVLLFLVGVANTLPLSYTPDLTLYFYQFCGSIPKHTLNLLTTSSLLQTSSSSSLCFVTSIFTVAMITDLRLPPQSSAVSFQHLHSVRAWIGLSPSLTPTRSADAASSTSLRQKECGSHHALAHSSHPSRC